MDAELKCNNTKCRRPFSHKDKIVATICSHIFCLSCSQSSFSKALVCPACGTSLPRSEEIAVNDTNPSEEWKSLVLAGLRPEIIMEVCSRALSVIEYQNSQERLFLENRCRKLEEHANMQVKQLQHAAHQYQQEAQLLEQKLSSLAKLREQEKKRNHELSDKYNEKTRQLQKLQQMYDQLKRKTIESRSALADTSEPTGPSLARPLPSLMTTTSPVPTIQGSSLHPSPASPSSSSRRSEPRSPNFSPPPRHRNDPHQRQAFAPQSSSLRSFQAHQAFR